MRDFNEDFDDYNRRIAELKANLKACEESAARSAHEHIEGRKTLCNKIEELESKLGTTDDLLRRERESVDAASRRIIELEGRLDEQQKNWERDLDSARREMDRAGEAATAVLIRERNDLASRVEGYAAQYNALQDDCSRAIKGLQDRLDAVTKDRDFLQVSRDSFRDAYEKSHEGERYEIRLRDDDGRLDEIVGHGRFHLEQMNTNEWFLELAGCALWINGKGVRLVPRDHNTWTDLLNSTRVVERRETKSGGDFLESSGVRR